VSPRDGNPTRRSDPYAMVLPWLGVEPTMTEEEAAEIVRRGEAELRLAFDTFDTSGDGRLDARELLRALHAVGERASEAEVRQLIAAVDHDRDGQIDFSEFVRLIEPIPPGVDPEADLREAFAVLDVDGDGYLSAGELRLAASHTDEIDVTEVDDMIEAADEDGDGRISFAEFRDLVREAG